MVLLTAGVARAAAPDTLGYQGRLTQGGIAVSGSVNVTFSLYAAATGGAALWTETQAVTVSTGLYSAVLGKTTSFPVGLFNQPLWIGVKVAVDPEMTPRQELTSTPYSQKAKLADSATTATTAANGVLSISSWTGDPGTLVLSTTAFAFIGGTTTVTIATSQRITAAGSASLTPSTAGTVLYDLCYQSTVPASPIYSIHNGYKAASATVGVHLNLSGASSVFGLLAGSYNIGMCAKSLSGGSINTVSSYDWSTGWAMVTQ